jgi:hypothetical protein
VLVFIYSTIDVNLELERETFLESLMTFFSVGRRVFRKINKNGSRTGVRRQLRFRD